MFVKIRRPLDSVSRFERLIGCLPAAIGLLLWSLMVLWPDGILIHCVLRNVRAQWFPTAPGEVISTKAETEAGLANDDDSFDASIRFRYSVNGQEFTGDRLSFLNLRDSIRSSNTQVVSAGYPIGQRVEVIYNPVHPSDSALERSFTGTPLAFAIFLTPFNLVMLSGWGWLVMRVNGVRSLPLRREGTRWSLLETKGEPAVVGLCAAGVLSFASTFVIGIYGWSDSLVVMLETWAILLVLSGLAYWHTRSLVLREPVLLILDDATGAVTFSKTETSAEFCVERLRLLGLEVDPPSPSYPDPESTKTHSLALAFVGDDGQRKQHVVLTSQDECQIAEVRAWIQQWAGLRGE